MIGLDTGDGMALLSEKGCTRIAVDRLAARHDGCRSLFGLASVQMSTALVPFPGIALEGLSGACMRSSSSALNRSLPDLSTRPRGMPSTGEGEGARSGR